MRRITWELQREVVCIRRENNSNTFAIIFSQHLKLIFVQQALLYNLYFSRSPEMLKKFIVMQSYCVSLFCRNLYQSDYLEYDLVHIFMTAVLANKSFYF